MIMGWDRNTDHVGFLTDLQQLCRSYEGAWGDREREFYSAGSQIMMSDDSGGCIVCECEYVDKKVVTLIVELLNFSSRHLGATEDRRTAGTDARKNRKSTENI